MTTKELIRDLQSGIRELRQSNTFPALELAIGDELCQWVVVSGHE